jgi:hypothetical protein
MREQLCMQGLGVAACFSVRELLLDLQSQADVLKHKLQYQHIYVSKSTILGAGMGVFAKHDMPEGVQPAAQLRSENCQARMPQQALLTLQMFCAEGISVL